MGVPVRKLAVDLVIVNRDEPYAGFDKTTRQKRALPELRPSVAIAEFGILAVETKRAAYARQSEAGEQLACDMR